MNVRVGGWLLVAGVAVLSNCAAGVVTAAPPQTGPETERRFPPLVVPAGFKATLFACDPLIEYPSVIAAGPRPGTVFVAVDYMAGLAPDVDRKSEVRLVQDLDGDGYAEVAPVFAAGFNSIQGITWHAGTVYVMHAPYLTAVRDADGDGRADDRRELFAGLGIPPEENPGRLHCANGVIAGHDGWLYLALGDHGCNVARPEGDRLVFEGGGILRCRPDGRDLHVFSTGLRNIYDVALDAELNVFVRDNENDGGDYKVRVCHSFFAADHGYPYKYYERPDEALPPLADLGLGSSAGGVAYLERQFPVQYRGNLFFCEWGRSVVRYAPKPSGSSFGPLAEIEFAAGAANDPYGFKPTDVVVDRNGTIVVSDWGDGQRPRRGRGRIYAIQHVGDGANQTGPTSQPPPKPARPEQWLAQLDSESYAERCEAQAEIESQGRAGLESLTGALAENRIGVRGRWHAVWAITAAACNATGSDRADLIGMLQKAAADPAASVRVQAVRAIADLADPILVKHRLDAGAGDAEFAAKIAAIGQGQDGPVLLNVVVALGRLRWSGTADWLQEHLKQADPTLAHAAMQALRRAANWPAVLKLLDLPTNEPLRRIALRALAEQFDPAGKVADGLIERLRTEQDDARRREYADLLTRIHKQPGPWVYWNYRPAPRPANTVAWERTEAIAAALDHTLADPDHALRLAVLKRMQREKVPVRLPTLSGWLADERAAECVTAILDSLRDQPAADVRSHVELILRDERQTLANRQAALAVFGQGIDESSAGKLLSLADSLKDGPVLAEVLRRAGKYPKLSAVPLLVRKLSSLEAAVRAAAIETLGELRADDARGKLVELLADADPQVRRAAAVAAGKLAAKEAADPLLKLAVDDDPAVRRASFDSLRILHEPRVVPLATAALNDRQADLAALETLRELGGPDQTAAVKEWAAQNPSTEVLLAAVRVLTAWRDRKETDVPRQNSLDRAVAEIHGTSGSLVRWNVNGSLPAQDAPALVEQLANRDFLTDSAAWRTVYAAGTDARVTLAPKDAPRDKVWVAYADVSVREPTEVELLASSSGSFQIWLQGRSLLARSKPQGFRIDSDRLGTTLAQGNNRLVVQAGPAGASPVEFHVRFRRKSATAELERLAQAAIVRPGNLDRGRQVFFNVEKSLCLKCHRLGEQGERTGPELTGVGSRFSRIYLAESILEPSRTIAPSFGTLAVLLADGTNKSGVKVAETDTTLTLVDNQGQKLVLPKAEIDQQRVSPLSTMPDSLVKRLSEEEFVDLVAFLANQKESRSP